MLLKELDHIPLAPPETATFTKQNKRMTVKYHLGKLDQHHLNVKGALNESSGTQDVIQEHQMW